MPVPVRFADSDLKTEVEEGATVLEAAARAGLWLPAPCGGEGTCGRCQVEIREGLEDNRLEGGDWEKVLACRKQIEGPLTVRIAPPLTGLLPLPPGPAVSDVMTSDFFPADPPLLIYRLRLTPPHADDKQSDLSRLRQALSRHNCLDLEIEASQLAQLPRRLRELEWQIQVTVMNGRLVDIVPLESPNPLALAVDLGTTSVWLELLDLSDGKILGGMAGPNLQQGEDVISRIIAANKPRGYEFQQKAAVASINQLLEPLLRALGRAGEEIKLVSLAGNTVMSHLLQGLNCRYLRLAPYVPAAENFPLMQAGQLGLAVCPHAPVMLMPAVSAYVGGDIVAGIMAAEMHQSEALTLFIDLGTNGEVALGNNQWMMAAAASAGPAFEGGGISMGMNFAPGAIIDFRLSRPEDEPVLTVLGGGRARGICGSGLLALLSHLLQTGILEPGGRLNQQRGAKRLREGEGGLEYVLQWGEDGHDDHDGHDGYGPVVVTEADIQNLLRAKGAMYAAYATLLGTVGLRFSDVEQIILAGSFGNSLNLEHAVTIGLLPELPVEKFRYVGNSSLSGARLAALSTGRICAAERVKAGITSLELAEQPLYMANYTAALFFPHTQAEELFPKTWRRLKNNFGG
ncbi:MAG: ASKHA domain-containing protein [Desulfarculales bacterium]|jgi:uncharacterized 2Fe-2S/4Fe-4S cluster protein (DUF4445 family)|nr:ASKHA domain-containing protein [Desulfarculales bacterium]